MKIFLAFLQSKIVHPIPAYGFWEYYIKNGIEEAGHNWLESEVDWAEGLVPKSKTEQDDWKSATWEKTIAFLRNNKPDVFLSYLYPQQVDMNAIREIQKMGIPCVNFFCDNIRLFEKIPTEFKVFDLNWVPEYNAVKLYQNAKLPHLNLPMPMWVEKKYRTISEEKLDQVTFIGSKDVQRELFFHHLIKLDPQLNLAIYGAAWGDENTVNSSNPKPLSYSGKIAAQFASIKFDGVRGYLRKLSQRKGIEIDAKNLAPLLKGKPTFETYIDLTKDSKITLGINRYPSYKFPLHKPDTYSRLRDIEAPMLGACYLTEWTAGLDQMFDLGSEIETYKNEAELLEKINELEQQPAKRKKLRINGQKRALEHNSIINTLNQIECFLKP